MQILVDRDLPDNPKGHERCEQEVRDFDEGFRELWNAPETKGYYLRQLVLSAFGLVRQIRDQQLAQLAKTLVRDLSDNDLQRFLRTGNARGARPPATAAMT